VDRSDLLVVRSVLGYNGRLQPPHRGPIPKLKTISIPELDASDEKFDAVFSYSSLEHDGLGRYGDPRDPDGDLKRMEKIKGLLKPGQILPGSSEGK